jgi:hypothetical protein
MALDLIRIALAFSILFFLRVKNINFNEILNFALTISVVVAAIGIIQTIDGLLFSNVTGINSILSILYPYPGELTGSAALKADGLQLKLSSAWGSTSVFDGHPILFSDFLVISSILFIYFKRYLGLSIIIIAVITTYTRGAWVAILFAFLFHYVFQSKKVRFKDILFFIAMTIAISTIVYSIEPLREYVSFRVLNTLASFDLIANYDIGRIGDPRTEDVWPAFFKMLSESGISGYLWGIPSSIPTDSGYLSIIQNSGLIGLFLIVSILVYIYIFIIDKHYKSLVILIFATLSILFIVHPVFQGYKTLYFLVFILLIASSYSEGRIVNNDEKH